MSVDTKRLASVFQRLIGDDVSQVKSSNPALHFAQCVNEVASLLPSVNITGVGTVSIPITKTGISKIRNAARTKSCNIQLEENSGNIPNSDQLLSCIADVNIESDSSSSLERALHHIGVLATRQMIGHKVADTVEVGLHLNHLIICSTGGHFSPHLVTTKSKKPEIMAKLMLQLPVKGGYAGAKLGIDSSSYDFSTGSQKNFYCAAYVSSSNVNFESVDDGYMAVLDFDLIWLSSTIAVTSVPALLCVASDFEEMEESLNAWNTNNLRRNEAEEVEFVFGFATDLLVIPLNEDYSESYFAFNSLRGRDVALTRYLQLIGFLDVHLAIISQNIDEISLGNSSQESFKIHRWIYSTSSLPQIQNYKLDFPKQLVGDIKTVLYSNEPCKPHVYHHPALVIQPRRQSLRHCGFINFDILLDHLESRYDLKNSELSRLDCLGCLGQVIGFCKENPLHVWDVEPLKAETRTRRLLTICRNLRAQKEGIKLISLLAKDFSKEESEIEFYEGVRSELVARDIVEMLWINQGWNVFSTQVLQLIQSSRLQNQLINFCQIAICLLGYGCIEGAKSVAHQILSSFPLVENLNQSQIDAYINVIIAIETHRANVDSVFEKYFLPFLIKISFQQQFQLLIDLEKNQSSGFINNPSYLEFFRKVAFHILKSRDVESKRLASKMINELSDCFLHQSDPKIREMFIWYVLRMPQDVIFVFNKACSTVTGKTAILNVLENEFNNLVKSAAGQLPSANEFRTTYSKKLSYLSIILVLTEDKLQLTEKDSILSRFVQLYDLMPTDILDSVVTTVIKYCGSYSALSSQRGLIIFQHLEESLINKESPALGKEPPVEALLKLLKYFADRPNSTTSLSQILLGICEKCRWGANDKILLIKKIIEFKHVWNSLAGSDDECNVFKSLLKSWIDCICEILRKNESDADEEDCYIRTSAVDCFLLYIRKTKSGFITAPGIELFLPLLEKMPVHKIGRIMSEIYQSDIKEPPPNLKMFELTRDLYRQLCQKFVMGDLTTVFRSTGGVFIDRFECLLWIEDEGLIKTFTDKILEFRSTDLPNSILEKINTSSRIRKLITVCPRSHSALCFVLEKWLGFVKQLIEKQNALSWQIPHISFPDHPVVEEFLRSSVQQMDYANFSNKNQAVNFSSHLSSLISSIENCSIDVKVVGDGFKCRCEISKINGSQEDKGKSSLEIEKDYVEKMLKVLKNHEETIGDAKSGLPNVRDDVNDDVVEMPVPKKQKPEPDIVDLD